MIPKADLLKATKEQEEKLQLIYKYNPSLRNLEENVKVLQSLGLEDESIREVVSKGSTYVVNTITNPQTGEEMAICVEEVSVKMDETGQYSVFIGKVPYMEFFTKTLLTREKLERLSKENPEVKALYKENQILKATLDLIGKKA